VLLAIKASIHHFLFLRKIYPQRWFKSERIFLTYTKACRHPTVREYVSEAIESIKASITFLLTGSLHEVLRFSLSHLQVSSAAANNASDASIERMHIVLQEPIACGHVQTVCLCIEMPGCAPHELLCIHPEVLLDANAASVPWEEVDGALRGFLLQMHSLQYAMPGAVEGMLHPAAFREIRTSCYTSLFSFEGHRVQHLNPRRAYPPRIELHNPQ
jgi:hypothetical protein